MLYARPMHFDVDAKRADICYALFVRAIYRKERERKSCCSPITFPKRWMYTVIYLIRTRMARSIWKVRKHRLKSSPYFFSRSFACSLCVGRFCHAFYLLIFAIIFSLCIFYVIFFGSRSFCLLFCATFFAFFLLLEIMLVAWSQHKFAI